MKIFFLIIVLFGLDTLTFGQAVPAPEENIPFLVTFGKNGSKKWGDDDFVQSFFFVIPETHKTPVFIRIFDPGTSGKFDEQQGAFDTKTRYSVYGGKGCITEKDARSTVPTGNFKSGNLLATKTFSAEYDGEWYTLGPFNPTAGENAPQYGGNVIKIIAEGISGNDGNLYRYFLSTSPTKNIPIEGGNAFTFEYTFRLNDNPNEISHVYPYIDDKVISIRQGNFDWDNDGALKVVTVSRLAIHLKKSGDGDWQMSEHEVLESEKGSTFDVQFHKNKAKPAQNNNLTFFLTNHYGEALPFFTIPIGGIPKPKTSIKVTPIKK